MKELNLAKRNNTWKVTFPWEGEESGMLVLHIKSPSKNVLSELLEIQKAIGGLSDVNNLDGKAIGALWDFATVAISNNKEKKEIDPSELEDNLALTDLFEFYTAYVEFVTEQSEGKNLLSRNT